MTPSPLFVFQCCSRLLVRSRVSILFVASLSNFQYTLNNYSSPLSTDLWGGGTVAKEKSPVLHKAVQWPFESAPSGVPTFTGFSGWAQVGGVWGFR